MQKCIDCDFYREMNAANKFGNCMYKPPIVQFIPYEAPMNAKTIQSGGVPQMQLVPASARPQVFQTDGCAAFTPKETH